VGAAFELAASLPALFSHLVSLRHVSVSSQLLMMISVIFTQNRLLLTREYERRWSKVGKKVTHCHFCLQMSKNVFFILKHETQDQCRGAVWEIRR